MLDKLTNDLFFRMNALNVNRIDFALGKGPPKVHVGLIALNDFYSRIILNKDGKLNLKDITANPQEAPTSLTRATGEPGSKGAVPVAPSLNADSGSRAERRCRDALLEPVRRPRRVPRSLTRDSR